MAKNSFTATITGDALRRSTRSRSRPVIFSNTNTNSSLSPVQSYVVTEKATMVSPEPVVSSSSWKTTSLSRPASGGQKEEFPSIPVPDRPVLSLSFSDEKTAAMMMMAKNTVTTGNKRKRLPTASFGKCATTTLRPTPEECEFVVLELGKLHPDVIEKCREIRERTTVTTNVASDCKVDKDIDQASGSSGSLQASSCGDQTNILDGVFSTMLSQNTTAANSTRAFANFKKAVPDWKLLPEDFSGYQQTIETAIHCGGLAQIKAANIVRLCQTIHEETGSVSLEYLRHRSNEDIQKDLLRHKGLGPKTVSCVLLFTLGRNEFPVDTHVWRIAKQHKWVPPSVSRDEAYKILNKRVPDHLKLELHCLMVQHGRECHRCAARGKPQFPPKDGSKLDCPLVHLNAIASSSSAAAAALATANQANGNKDYKVKREEY